ncbi:MAG: archease [Nitrososphaeraceae archaeon]
MSRVDYRYIDHMSDAMVEAYGRTLSEAFANSARALINIVCDISKIDLGKSITIQTTGFDLVSLLYNWLEKVLMALLVDNLALAKFQVMIERRKGSYYLSSACGGEAFVGRKHHYKVEVKAITYHEMKVTRSKGKFVVQFLADL